MSNSQTVKPVSMTMIKSVFGDIFTDFIKEETTYKMSEPCKRLFTMTFMGEYTEGKLDRLIEQISSDKQIQNTLKKKLKGKYEKDTVTLMNVAGLDGDNYRKLALKYKLTGVTSGTYKEIVAYLKDNGEEMSQMAVCNYAKKYLATVEMVNIAQTNFSMLMDEMNKYPDLDTSEALIRLSSHHVINALTSLDEEQLKDVPVDKLIKETNGLIRAAAYKKRIEVQNQETFESGLEAVKSLVFEAMSKENPALYAQVNAFLNALNQLLKNFLQKIREVVLRWLNVIW